MKRPATERASARFLDLSRWITSGRPLEEVLYQVVLGIEESVDYDHCTLFVRDTDTTLERFLEPLREKLHPNRYAVVRLRRDMEPVWNTYETGQARILQYKDSSTLPDGYRPIRWDPYLMVLPIQSRDQCIGAVAFSRRDLPNFTQKECDLAQIFINYACTAISLSYLESESNLHKRLFHRLAPFTEKVNHPFKVNEVMEAIGRGALALSGADRVAVYRQNLKDRQIQFWSKDISYQGLVRFIDETAHEYEEQGCTRDPISFYPDVRQLPLDSNIRMFAENEGIRALANCPIAYQKQVVASVDYYFNHTHDWSFSEKESLEIYSRQAAVALENTHLYEELEETYFETVMTLVKVLDIRDSYTARHSRRLANWAENTARKLNLSPEEVQIIRWAAILHDIGKIGVPDSILMKAGPLTADEWGVMKRHPELGAEIVAPVRKLRQVTPIIRAHQEKFDGSGYPDGLAGEKIPLAARILTVVDAFGAMTDDRVYRKARTRSEAVDELKRCSGTHFDQKVVQVFFDVLETSPLTN